MQHINRSRLTPIIIATQEAEIKRITVQSRPGQIVPETLFQKKRVTKRGGGVAQGVYFEFKPQYCKKCIYQNIPELCSRI
jgi:hypothetical protein